MDRWTMRLQILAAVAGVVRSTRLNLAWSQRELSRRSGVPQSKISLIERQRVKDIRVSVIDRLLRPMGARYWLGIDLPTLAPRRQADAAHARCSSHVERRLKASG